MLRLVYYPHPTLRHRSKPLRRVDQQVRRWVEEMFSLMYEHQGVGLAANQVDLPYRIFVMNPTGDPEQKEQELAVINPVLSRPRGSQEEEEGCLSLPEVRAPVVRAARVILEGFTLEGKALRLNLEGFPARVAQHEADHLDGVLFIDRLAPTVLAQVKPAVEELELEFRSRQGAGEIPPEEAILTRLAQLEQARCQVPQQTG